MRKAFLSELLSIAEQDSRVWLLTADIGLGVIEPFREALPERYIDFGISEQLMLGAAMGLASVGAIPFCYSINNFVLLRPFEFIRHAAHLRLNVKLVSVGQGKEYGALGFTQWDLEGHRLVSALPSMTCYVLKNEADAQITLRDSYQNRGVGWYSVSRYDDHRRPAGVSK